MFSAFANMDNNEKENQPKVENLDGSVLSLRKNIFKENNFIDAPSEHTSSKNIEEDVGNVEYNYNLTLTKTMLLDGTQDKKKLRNGKCVSIKDSPKSKRIKKYVDKREQLDNYWNQIIKQKSPVIVENKEEKCYVSPRKIETKKEFDISDDIRCETDNDLQMANDEVYNQSKKPKFKEIDLVENDIKMQKKKDVDIPQKCEYCCQKLVESEIKLYQGHPNGAVEEFIALTDPRLSLFTGEEAVIHESDERPQNKLTYFSVYDKNGHLCSFDSGLIEKNVVLYFSGYMKAIYEDDASPDGGVPTKDMGPINEWWISGFDGGELALIGFNTPFAEYILMEPSEAYATFMDSVREKIYMSKIVIEFLLDEINPTYEDLLNKLQTMVPPKGLTKFTEDALLRHAQFICDQVISFDSSGRPEDSLLITNACMRALVSLAGITVGKRIAMRKVQQKHHKIKKQNWTKATTTKLVNYMFETFFTDQLAKDSEKDVGGPRRHRCGVCEACQQSDCGTCLACKDMTKFRGSGKSKQACFRRRCPNMAIQEADDSDPEEDEQTETFVENTKITQKMILKAFKHVEKEITWIGEPIINDGRRTFYTTVRLIDEEIKPQNYVLIESSDPSVPLQIAKVMYMWEDKSGAKMCHANWFRRGSDTVLGETSDPLELFALDECDNVPFTSIKCKATVVYKKTPTNWADMGNIDMLSENEIKDDGKTFFYQKRYTSETARFEDIAPDITCTKKEIKHRFCSACVRFTALQCYYTPKIFEFIEEKSSKEVIYGMIKYKGEEFRVGSAVFLSPNAVKFKYTSTFHTVTKSKKGKVDEDMYPEYYRKSSDHVKGSNHDTPEPFHVGYINAIYATTNNKLVAASDIWIKVNKMYRPENTHKGLTLMHQVDLNTLYWSNEVCNVRFSEVAGKCYLAYSENLDQSVQEWSAAGPHRFYFSQVYNVSEKTFDEPPYNATNIGKYGKGKGKGKGKKLESNETKKPIDTPVNYSGIPDRLKMLDLFAGCGGLSEGLHQAGIAESKWAIEKEEAAAYAYRLNYPTAIVFSEDCNVLLRKVLNDEVCDDNGQHLPQKGEVELLCGGPPCQGFSGMNRFNSRQYSLFKNSLVVSCLSWCDYYRPKFFIMENVRNFVSFKKSMVLKLTLRCLVRMGYQCTFGILQAGNYGIPQTRRRLIILAAAPGEMLPKYPEPTHVFSKRACHLSVIVDNKKYSSNCDWVDSAPFRTICVRDAMSDLPNIRNGWNKEEMSYGDEPISHFQRMMRRNERDSILRDHICKDMAPLVEARIAHIPTASGSDWRDLPNIVVRMSDGTYTKKLEYTHHDKKVGRSSTGAYRGVCACCAGKVCDPIDRQYNTLIPWCLPHTANRHNHWAGLYGRLEWDGFFGTTITNPEPMGKQGRVLHPEQTRVVSIRECARSQGFPDCFRFYGNILDKHRQVGNAVPPPLGAAIGYEIRKCLKKEDVTTLQIKCEEVN